MRTKIQYKDFEPGEFTSIKDRTVEETIDLITSFPWQDQRDHLVVSLTSPGITIEGPNNDFLKLTPYYNGKYVLHYLDGQHHLYTRPLDRLEDSIPVIQAFFETQPFDPAGFRKEPTLLKNNIVHFVTNDFRYIGVNPAQITNLTLTSLGFLTGIVIMALISLKQHFAWLFSLPFMALLGTWLTVFINHYKAIRGNVLILSKGLDAFSYGPADNPTTFYKHDIANIATYGQQQKGGGFGAFTYIEIIFTNGTWLQISCLMLNWYDLLAKFPPGPRTKESQWFPFMNRDASALSE